MIAAATAFVMVAGQVPTEAMAGFGSFSGRSFSMPRSSFSVSQSSYVPTPRPVPSTAPTTAYRPVAPAPVTARPMAEPVAGGSGGIIKPPASGGGLGGGARLPAGGGSGVNRFGADSAPVSSSNNWMLWYLMFNNSHNTAAASTPHALVSSAGGSADIIRSFKCEPQSGQLAKDWMRQCEAPAGQLRLRISKGCEPQPTEQASAWVQRCATRFGNDW